MTRVVPVVTVVPPRVLLLDLVGPLEALRKASLEQDRVRFDIRYVGPRATAGTSLGLGLVGVDPLPERLPDDALVLVPGAADEPLGGRPDPEADRMDEVAIVAWLRRVVDPRVRLVTVCSGAMLAARAGLFDGYDCTTHHGNIAELAALAPAARVRENRLFVEDRGRLSSAGITAGIDLALHIVAQLVDYATAAAVARYLVVYMRRAGGDPQLSPWLEGRNHMHPAIHRLQDVITADPARAWSVESLAREAGASPRNLSRLFNLHTGLTVMDYVNRMRVALARELVLHSRLGMEAVAERSGFSSSRQFRRAWNWLEPMPPNMLRGGLHGSGTLGGAS